MPLNKETKPNHPSSSSFSTFVSNLRTVIGAPFIISITVTFMFHKYLVLWQGLSTCISFDFHSVIRRDRKDHKLSFCFVNYISVRSSGSDLEICLYFNISEKFIHLILREVFWFVHITLFSLVTFKFLAQFQVDHFPHPGMSISIGWLVGFRAYQLFSGHLTPIYISNILVLYEYSFCLQAVKCQNTYIPNNSV